MTQMQVGTMYPEDAFEELTTGDVVTGQRVIVDGDRDKEVVMLDPHAGASSIAPPSSGIPSAMRQHGACGVTEPTRETTMAGRLQKQIQTFSP